ncbi:MAG: antibiotic biosynthesis monooxygenase family protein, partial [Myxococcota bacterium]
MKTRTSFGDFEAAGAAQKKPGTEMLLEGGEAPTDYGCGELEPHGGLTQASHLADGDEELGFSQKIHSVIVSYLTTRSHGRQGYRGSGSGGMVKCMATNSNYSMTATPPICTAPLESISRTRPSRVRETHRWQGASEEPAVCVETPEQAPRRAMQPAAMARGSGGGRFLRWALAALTPLLSLSTGCGSQTTMNTESPDKQLVLHEGGDYLTVLNILVPEPGEQTAIIDLLETGLTESIRFLPGFRGAAVHRSLDNDYIAVYAQWDDQAALDNAGAMINAGSAPAMQEVFTRAQPEYHPYPIHSITA